ncbi:MAG: DUF2752 domain-containing protein [Sphingobacteriales bacterium]|nr:MAG: DUF2752 domain-containing protein [Sphingobacteriales bacterium]
MTAEGGRNPARRRRRKAYLGRVIRCMRIFLPSLLWGCALVALFFLDPAADGPSLCLFKTLGVPWCPGCGLGHAVHFALKGQWNRSLAEHWLGLPVTAALVYQTVKPLLQKNKLQNHLQWTRNK